MKLAAGLTLALAVIIGCNRNRADIPVIHQGQWEQNVTKLCLDITQDGKRRGLICGRDGAIEYWILSLGPTDIPRVYAALETADKYPVTLVGKPTFHPRWTVSKDHIIGTWDCKRVSVGITCTSAVIR